MIALIEIDGSYGSGGGQVLRTALGLSALTLKPITIDNIRSGRPDPGLKAQHLTAVNTIASICNAVVEGAEPKSTKVSFSPSKISATNLNVNIGTAGSITLLLQTILLPSLVEEVKLRIIGGTDVRWSPGYYYMQDVLLPILSKFGARYSLNLVTHGYYPKGQGIVSFKSSKTRLPLKPVKLTNTGKPLLIKLFSHSSSLPREVSVNQALAAKKELEDAGITADITESIESKEKTNTIGSGIDLIAELESGAVLGANFLGAKGLPAMDVGKEAAQNLVKELNANAPVDEHLADQLIPFMALAKGKSGIHTTLLSEHTLTNIFVCEKLLDVKFNVEGEKEKPATITVEGIGFS